LEEEMKRIIALLVLIAIIGITPLFANGGKEETGSKSEGGLEEVTLRFYFWGNSREKVPDVYEAISEAYKTELNAKFEVNFIPGSEYRQKVVAIAASGDDYDMNFDGNWVIFDQMASKGAYLNLNDLLPEYAPNLANVYKKMPGVLEAATVDGEVVGLPWTMSMNQRPYFRANKAAAEEAGVSFGEGDIKTFEDIDKFLGEMAAYYKGSGKEMIGPVSKEPMLLYGELVDLNFSNLVYSINDPDCKVMPLEQTDAYLVGAQWAEKWNNDGYILKDSVLETVDGNTLLSEGMRLSGFSWHEWAWYLGKDPKGGLPSEMYPEKKFANRTPLSNMCAINANAANPERTLMFLDLVETDRKMYDLFHYGIEGVTYKLEGEMAVYAVEGMTSANSNYMEWGGQWAFWKPQFMRPNATYGPGFWEEEKRLATLPKNINAPLAGFFPKSDNIKNEVAARETIWQFNKEISYGVAGDADAAVAKMIAEQKKAGIDAIVADVQKQVDAYLGK
jgi:putative aldouronate transport system substrate-binding protein